MALHPGHVGVKTAARKLAIIVFFLPALLVGCSAPRIQPRITQTLPKPPRTPSPLFEPAFAPTLLDSPERDRWQKPAEIVRALNLERGQIVADVGAGSGYLLPYLSRAVGPHGTVYAEEIQKEFLPKLRRKAKELKNIRVVMGAADDPRLPPGGIDCFVLLTVYHEVQQPVAFLRTLRRFARPGAQLAIIDFDANRQGDPPAPPDHQVAEADVIAEAQTAGWQLVGRHEFLSSQFYLVFRPVNLP